MEAISQLMNCLLHIDKYLTLIIHQYGMLIYIITFLIIFCETGLVITPFLPGDSMIFSLGALSSTGTINIFVLLIIIYTAAVLGDTSNYYIGRFLGKRVLEKEKVMFINKKHVLKAQAYYEKYGAATIVLARFIPVIRTIAPLVAGMAKMKYLKFISFNFLSAVVWTFAFLGGGYFFGNMSFVQNNFSLVVILSMIVSIIPAVAAAVYQKLPN